MDNIEEFLYLTNFVFAPMIAVMIADFFFNKKRRAVKEWDWGKPGCMAYWTYFDTVHLYACRYHNRLHMADIVITAVLCMVVHRILPQNHLDKAI